MFLYCNSSNSLISNDHLFSLPPILHPIKTPAHSCCIKYPLIHSLFLPLRLSPLSCVFTSALHRTQHPSHPIMRVLRHIVIHSLTYLISAFIHVISWSLLLSAARHFSYPHILFLPPCYHVFPSMIVFLLIRGDGFGEVSGNIWIDTLHKSQLICDQLKEEKRR